MSRQYVSKNRCQLALSSTSRRRSSKLARVAMDALSLLRLGSVECAPSLWESDEKGEADDFVATKGTNGSADNFFQLLGCDSRAFTLESNSVTSFTCCRRVGQSGSSRSKPG